MSSRQAGGIYTDLPSKEKAALWRANNPDAMSKHQAKYREANREKRRAYNREYYAANRERKMWDARQRKYGISAVEFAQRLLDQEGMCGLCSQSLPDNFSKIAVDHNHETGQVRSLLHFSCNVAVGVYENFHTELHQYVKVFGDN